MAEHSTSQSHSGAMAEHRATYQGFVRGSIVVTLLCFFVLVALVSFRFGHAWHVFLGFLTIFAGLVGTLIDIRTGSRRFTLSLVLLVVFGLITAINVA
jgi:hypothetical protein